MPENGDERDEVRRPTPVRMVMEGGNDGESVQDDLSRVFLDTDTGAEWSVTLTGWSASGVLPLRTVPLLELTFAKAESPEKPLRKALCRGETLGEMSDEDLQDALRDSEPFRPPMREPELVDKNRGRGRSRRPPPRG